MEVQQRAKTLQEANRSMQLVLNMNNKKTLADSADSSSQSISGSTTAVEGGLMEVDPADEKSESAANSALNTSTIATTSSAPGSPIAAKASSQQLALQQPSLSHLELVQHEVLQNKDVLSLRDSLQKLKDERRVLDKQVQFETSNQTKVDTVVANFV
jgi:hypothetical protein